MFCSNAAHFKMWVDMLWRLCDENVMSGSAERSWQLLDPAILAVAQVDMLHITTGGPYRPSDAQFIETYFFSSSSPMRYDTAHTDNTPRHRGDVTCSAIPRHSLLSHSPL